MIVIISIYSHVSLRVITSNGEYRTEHVSQSEVEEQNIGSGRNITSKSRKEENRNCQPGLGGGEAGADLLDDQSVAHCGEEQHERQYCDSQLRKY